MTAIVRLSIWGEGRTAEELDRLFRALEPLMVASGLSPMSEGEEGLAPGVAARLFGAATVADAARAVRAAKGSREWPWGPRERGRTEGSPPGIRHELRLRRAQAGPGHRREVGHGYRQGLWVTYGGLEGPNSSIILSAARDESGNLWFGTQDGGVCRYDGSAFVTFTEEDGLAHNTVAAIHQQADGELWFGTHHGVSRYDGVYFVNYGVEDGLADAEIHAIAADGEGRLWFGTDAGVSTWGEAGLRPPVMRGGELGGVVRALADDESGRMWLGTDSGLYRSDGEEVGPADGDIHEGVSALARSRAGGMWVSTAAGCGRLGPEGMRRLADRDLAAIGKVLCMTEDAQGELWVGTQADGVSRCDGALVTSCTTVSGLPNNTVNAVVEDGARQVWLGTHGGGVCRYDGGRMTHFGVADGLPSDILVALAEDTEGNMWIGTAAGVARWDGREFTTFTTRDGLVDNTVQAILQDTRGQIWIGTLGGISRYDGRTFETFTAADGLCRNEVTAILEDRAGRLWVGTAGGVSCFDGETWSACAGQAGLGWRSVRAIVESASGVMWFGSEAGVSRFDGREFSCLTTDEGLAGGAVQALSLDRNGDLWIGTRTGGVYRHDGEHLHRLTVREGLTSNHLRSICEDDSGRLWFATFGGGVNAYDGEVVQHIDRKRGLANDIVNDICQDSRGRMWMATEGGLCAYRPQQLEPSIQVGLTADRTYESPARCEVAASARALTFDLSGHSLTTHPDDMAYLHRLKGMEDDWQVTVGRRVTYEGLPTGQYTFEARAVDVDLNRSAAAAIVVEVVVDPRVAALTEALGEPGQEAALVGASVALRRLQAQLTQVAPTDMTVLLSGETGTGKGMVARLIHSLSPRSSGPFVQVNCGALPEGLVESELFGHERGAFTGAVSRRLGRIELAREGTLLLDEVGDLAAPSQAKLLRILEEETFERVGGTETLRSEARIVAATNRDLQQMVENGRFREDLYYRLAVFPVEAPPLRDRMEDVPLLAEYFLVRACARVGKAVTEVSQRALALLLAYRWPGNVRELRHVIERAVIVCNGSSLSEDDIALDPDLLVETLTLREAEKRHILRTLAKTGWVVRGDHGAATLLGLPESTLRSRMERLGIVRRDHSSGGRP